MTFLPIFRGKKELRVFSPFVLEGMMVLIFILLFLLKTRNNHLKLFSPHFKEEK
jgi:hypothetical protein